jgi:hypothetical protein
MDGAAVRILLFPSTGEVEVSADRTGLGDLAALVASGDGAMAGEDTSDLAQAIPLTRLRVRTREGEAVMISADTGGRTLTVTGAPGHLGVLAEILGESAAADDGGHIHIEHYPDHPYLGEGSLPLIVNNPAGGMPRRVIRRR